MEKRGLLRGPATTPPPRLPQRADLTRSEAVEPPALAQTGCLLAACVAAGKSLGSMFAPHTWQEATRLLPAKSLAHPASAPGVQSSISDLFIAPQHAASNQGVAARQAALIGCTKIFRGTCKESARADASPNTNSTDSSKSCSEAPSASEGAGTAPPPAVSISPGGVCVFDVDRRADTTTFLFPIPPSHLQKKLRTHSQIPQVAPLYREERITSVSVEVRRYDCH